MDLLAALRPPRKPLAVASAFAVAIGLGSLAYSGGFRIAVPPTIAADSEPSFPSERGSRIITNASCSAGACHGASAAASLAGSPPPGAMWPYSASHWQAVDPHAGTYALLIDRPSRPDRVQPSAMIRRLGWCGPATAEARCLACHTDPALTVERVGADPEAIRLLRSEGVGCQACHGRADNWLTGHTAWTGAREPLYKATGMTPLYDAAQRASTCAGCHIGAPETPGQPVRDVNHDMIAAGHPRLTYDFAEHHRRLPKHWSEKRRTAAGGLPPERNFEIRLCLVGRAVRVEAECGRRRDRAERSEAGDCKSPWPELAEFRCASCHHEISGEGAPAGPRASRPPPWRFSGPKDVRESAGGVQRGLAESTNSLNAAPDAALPALLLGGLRIARRDAADGDDLLGLLHGLAAFERNRRRDLPAGAKADDADFDAAYECARKRDWPGLRQRLDALLRRIP